MTSDGISEEDWTRVRELAVEIADSVTEENDAQKPRARMFELLDQLDKKYGRKPSVLATRADYIESPEIRESLLQAAYTEAERITDISNMRLIAHSLAEFYLEEVQNREQGTKWLQTWRFQVGGRATNDDRAELERLASLAAVPPNSA